MAMVIFRNTIIFICLVLPSLSFGQRFLHSPDEYVNEGRSLVQIVGKVGSMTACFVEGDEGLSLIWYDSLMRKAGTSPLHFLEDGAQEFSFQNKEDGAYVFYQKRKKKQLELWAAKIPPLHKDTIYPKKIDGALLGGNWDKSRFVVYSNETKNRFVYSFSSKVDVQQESDLTLNVLDQNFNVVRKHTELFSPENYPGVVDVLITPQDDLYIVMASERVDQFYSRFSMGILKANAENIQVISWPTTSNRLVSPSIAFHEEAQRIVLGGMQYNSQSKEPRSLTAYPFDLKSETWLAPAKTPISRMALRAPSLNLSNLRLRNFNLKQDGGFSYLLETSFVEKFTRSRNMGLGLMGPGISMGGTSYTIFHDDELYAIDAAADGSMRWNKMIMKSQQTSDANSRFQSFGTLQSRLGNVFLFLDKPKGQNRFVTAFLSNEGLLTLRQFTPKAYEELATEGVILRASKQVGANEIVFPIVSRGTLSFAKIVF